MCGIWCLFRDGAHSVASIYTATLLRRGPEQLDVYRSQTAAGNIPFALGFTRLAINGLNPKGMQPFHLDTPQGRITWMVNGEIYNYQQLADEHGLGDLKTGSDCEVVGHLYAKFASQEQGLETLFRALDGVFALTIWDAGRQQLVVARDPYGVRPLYYSHQAAEDSTENFGKMTTCFASELKAFPQGSTPKAFPPGNFGTIRFTGPVPSLHVQPYHNTPFLKNPSLINYESAKQHIYHALLTAVKKRVHCTERPIGALLSGGIDSSLIAALVQMVLKEEGKPPLKTFSIGFEGSEDLKHARLVAEHIGSDHYEIVATPDTFFAAIPEVIEAIESYDLTTVRASVGNYLVSKYISYNTDCKVIFNGDGSDEIFGSYLYFYRAPTDTEYEAEVSRLLKDIHMFDVLRSDRSISSNGLEARTPFLDRQFVATARSVPTQHLRPVQGQKVEKQLLRDAFSGTGILPEVIIRRRKEAFSDAVNGAEVSWKDEILKRVENLVPTDWKKLGDTKEQAYYRLLFDNTKAKRVVGESTNPNCQYRWLPRWSGETTDPSARTLSIY
jgi:asparagine synthase (glutamine-hydrolysing)